MKAASVFPSEFNQFATAFCKIWFLLSERSSLLTKKKTRKFYQSWYCTCSKYANVLHVQQHLYSLIHSQFYTIHHVLDYNKLLNIMHCEPLITNWRWMINTKKQHLVGVCAFYEICCKLGKRNLPDEKLHRWSHQTLLQVAR